MAVSVASTHTWQLELSADTSPSTTNNNNPTTGRTRSSSNPTTLRMESPSTSSSSRAVADPSLSSSNDPSNGPSGIPSPQVGIPPAPGQLYHSSATNPFQPQPSPNQQQQQWTPSPNAVPFYPQFTPLFHPAATPPMVPQPHQAYFDPNQQIAWAYQQMMLQQAAIAQQHHQNQFNQAMAEFGRTRANSGGPQQPSGPATPNDFFPPPPGPHQNPLIPGFPFNAGTPPAHPYNGSPQQSFRGRGPPRSNTFDNQDWNRLTAQGLPVPYARPEAAGSSHSINSSNGSTGGGGGGGGGASSRTRTNSNNTNKSQTPPSSLRGHGHMHSYGGGQNTSSSRSHTVPQLTTDLRQQGQPARQGSSGPPSPAVTRTQPHQRTVSNTSDRTASSSSRGGQSASSSPTVATSSNHTVTGGSVASASSSAAASTTGQPSSSSANGSPNLSPVSRTNQRTPAKPSPLSQQQTFAEAVAGANSVNAKRAKRLSKDDSELLPPTTVANALSARQSGLKGRFKRALAFNPPQALDESPDGASSIGHGDISPNGSASGALHVSGGDGGDIASPVTPVNSGDNVRSKPKSRLFNGKFNASTDNISLSSTVSSASMMIRKLGSIGKLARRNTLTNITGIFKGDKNKDKEGKKSKKGDKSEPSVSHATAELDRGEDEPALAGLTPAARVARQHTLKTNAEAARRLREQAAATSAAAAAAAMTGSSAPSALPDAWEKNTTNNHSRAQASTSSRGVSEDGTLREDRSDDGSGEGGYDPQYDPNATIRMTTVVDLEEDDDEEPWAVGLRRSIEKTRTPGKPVIKNHVGYIQEHHLDPPNQPFAARIRSNSYQTVAESQPGPLAHLPSPDPDHIDGLQRSNSTHNTPEKKPFSLPAFSFEFGDAIDILPKEDEDGKEETDDAKVETHSAHHHQDTLSSTGVAGALANAADKGPTFAYTHPTANSSAPALSTMFNANNKNAGPTNVTGGGHLTGMKKHITFAATLSIYDTFSSSAYDRRSEPSTANRLTPALAQRIKEELNSFKMEEMEVHSASKIHTHFFV